jgi:hypothetical protein
MPAHYVPLLQQSRTSQDADRELNEAFEGFESDGDDDDYIRSAPHNHANTLSMYPTDPLRGTSGSPIVPGAYDFERNYDYDRPPPGSPTHPTATTLPNDIGNSNGELPTSPLGTTMPHPSFLRRAVGAILPTHYVRIPTDETHAGSQNDGVFSNVFAKTTSSAQVQVEDGSIYMMPEETQSTAPPVCIYLIF